MLEHVRTAFSAFIPSISRGSEKKNNTKKGTAQKGARPSGCQSALSSEQRKLLVSAATMSACANHWLRAQWSATAARLTGSPTATAPSPSPQSRITDTSVHTTHTLHACYAIAAIHSQQSPSLTPPADSTPLDSLTAGRAAQLPVAQSAGHLSCRSCSHACGWRWRRRRAALLVAGCAGAQEEGGADGVHSGAAALRRRRARPVRCPVRRRSLPAAAAVAVVAADRSAWPSRASPRRGTAPRSTCPRPARTANKRAC